MDAAQQDSDPQTVLNFAMSFFSNLIDNKLENFARTMSQQSGSNVDEAVRRAKRAQKQRKPTAVGSLPQGP